MSEIPQTILIADDEPPARSKLVLFIKELFSDATILEASDGLQALSMLMKHSIDLLFLDIKMPGISGMEVAQTLGADNLPPTIFVTAYDEHAVQAFEVEALDYLLKPFDRERFRRAVSRLKHSDDPMGSSPEALRHFEQNQPLEFLFVKAGRGSVLIKTEDIHFLQAEEKYVHIHLADHSAMLRSSLKALLKRLNRSSLVQIHRRTAVNLAFVKRMVPHSHGDKELILANGVTLRVSRRYRYLLPEM